MNIFQAIVLGVAQGLGEFLPISSSGHIELAERLMGMNLAQGGADPTTLLTVMLHIGTLAAVIVVFWQEWIGIFKDKIVKSKLLGLLILASIPALVWKLGLKVLHLEEGKGFLGLAFIVTGIFLLMIEKVSHRGRHCKGANDVKPRNALIMGCMQALAMLPGISRSGSTILGGVGSGLSKKTAIRFSFLMSAPAILGGFLLEMKDAMEPAADGVRGIDLLKGNIVPIAVGVVCAAIVGYLSIRFMLKLFEKLNRNWFALYMFLLGAAVLALQLTGTLGFPPITAPYVKETAEPAMIETAIGALRVLIG